MEGLNRMDGYNEYRARKAKAMKDLEAKQTQDRLELEQSIRRQRELLRERHELEKQMLEEEIGEYKSLKKTRKVTAKVIKRTKPKSVVACKSLIMVANSTQSVRPSASHTKIQFETYGTTIDRVVDMVSRGLM